MYYAQCNKHLSELLRAHSFIVGLVAIKACGQVSHCCDRYASTFLRIRVGSTEVSQPLKKLTNSVLIMADEVGVFGDVITIPKRINTKDESDH